MNLQVLLTDYAWADTDVERGILAEHEIALVVADRADADSLARLAQNCQAIMATWAQVSKQVIDACADCRIVSRMGIGLDNIDVGHCTERGIVVTNVPDYCVAEVAEHALALLLSTARQIAFFHHLAKGGKYDLTAGVAMRRVEGQTLGVIGMGRIGRRLAKNAQGIGLRVIAASRSVDHCVEGVDWVEMDQLLAESDFVSLHLPLTPETNQLIGAAQLARMKPTATLINTARGGLVDHKALAAWLAEHPAAGAALDVQDVEPPDLSKPPWNLPRVIVTPHAAFVSEQSVLELRRRATRQVADRLQGLIPANVVNPSVLDR